MPGEPRVSPFERIREMDDDGVEYWSARKLAKVLGYTEYGKFKHAIHKAETACEASGQPVGDHFAHVSDMVAIGSGAQRSVDNVHLSRYACYLIVQNADPEKPIVALGQAYFAVQTRRAEMADALEGMSDAQKRLYLRGQVSEQTSCWPRQPVTRALSPRRTLRSSRIGVTWGCMPASERVTSPRARASSEGKQFSTTWAAPSWRQTCSARRRPKRS